MTASTSPLYARLQEFAMPVSAKEDAAEEHREEEQEHSSLFERVNAEAGTLKGSGAAYDADAAIPADILKRASFTADMPELKINPDLAESNLTDGYKLHDMDFSNLDKINDNPGSIADSTASKYSALTGDAEILPVLELDYSSGAASTAAQRGAPEPTGARHATV